MRSIITLLIASIILCNAYSQETRLALVIGNSAYEHGGVLKNPVHDALAMKEALEKVDFDVIYYTDLDEGGLKKAMDGFGLALKNYQVGLFYYAGHGIQASGENYLIPVDADLSSEEQVEYDCVEIARVLSLMEAAGSSNNILVLDACRNNPFERSWSRSSSGKGLAFMDAPTGTLIAYATAPGRTASDGRGENGLYTEAILESMQLPGISILEMFQNVRKIVKERSEDKQIPWESTSMIGNFYFVTDELTDSSTEQRETRSSNEDANAEKEIARKSGLFTDHRDGKDYVWIRIGEQVWMGENLNYVTEDGSWCYKDKKKNCDRYGRLYNWKTAQKVCPQGWHLPDTQEWLELERFLIAMLPDTLEENQAEIIAASMLKAKIDNWNYTKTPYRNASGFNALPGGILEAGVFKMENKMTSFWTSEIQSAAKAYSVGMYHVDEELSNFGTNIQYGFSVRCIKNN